MTKQGPRQRFRRLTVTSITPQGDKALVKGHDDADHHYSLHLDSEFAATISKKLMDGMTVVLEVPI